MRIGQTSKNSINEVAGTQQTAFQTRQHREIMANVSSGRVNYIQLPICGVGIENPALISYVDITLLPWAAALYWTRIKALSIVYPRQLAEHAIDRQSYLSKEKMLCYAFFLDAVRDEGYTAVQLRELSTFSELTCKPPKPGLIQNLGFASFIAFMIALSMDVIKSTSLFTSGKEWVFYYWKLLEDFFIGQS